MVTVEDLLTREGIYYKSAGKDILVNCLNPEHEDNSPSMRIDRITGMFNCFSCNHSGNIFAAYNEDIDVVGIRILQMKKKISSIMDTGMLLPLGCEPFAREHRNIKKETYEHFEAFIHDQYEGRIVFPIRDITGKLLATMGRFAFSNAQPKYLVDPPHVELPIFPPKPDIYRGSVILVEGIFDMLNLWDKGLTNVVCGFGKIGDSKKHNKQAKSLQKFIPLKIQGVKKIYVLYDKGADKSSDSLANLLSTLFLAESVKYPEFSDDKDPGNLTQKEVDDLKDFIYES